MEKAVTRRKWTAGLLIAGTVALVVAFWSLIMSMLSLLAVAGVLTLLSLPLCKVLEKRLPGEHFIAFAYLHFGDEPDEIFGHDGNSCHGSYFALARIGHRSLQMQVEAFFYFNPDIHYIICEC